MSSPDRPWHRRAAPFFVLVTTSLLITACRGHSPSMLDTKGSEAHRIAGVWWLMFSMAAGVYVIVAGFIIVASMRGRRTESGRPTRLTDDGLIWVGGIIVPTIILAVLAVVTVHSSTHLRQAEPDPVHIEVVGEQWWWRVSYPDQHIDTANEIHVPVGRPIEIGITSADVIHSFWVPQLAGKLDALPDQRNVLRFTANDAGTYRGECAEYCGLQHANMAFTVIAEPAAEFDRWLAQHENAPSGPTSDLQARGEVAFMRLPCAGCHTIRGTAAQGTVGPDLTDFGGRKTIGAGTVPNTTGNLAGWISNSQSIKPGNKMPPISIEPADQQALIAYLESLG